MKLVLVFGKIMEIKMEDKITISKYEILQPDEEVSNVSFNYKCLNCKQFNIFLGKYEDARCSVICPKCLAKYTAILERPDLRPLKRW